MAKYRRVMYVTFDLLCFIGDSRHVMQVSILFFIFSTFASYNQPAHHNFHNLPCKLNMNTIESS